MPDDRRERGAQRGSLRRGAVLWAAAMPTDNLSLADIVSRDFWERAGAFLIDAGATLLVVAAILVAGWWMAGIVRRAIKGVAKRNARLDPTLFSFLGSLASYAVLAFALVAALERLGVATTSIVAIIGAAGLAIGLALQGTLTNLAAGVMLLVFRPFKVGDVIDGGGVLGAVTEISLFTTQVKTADARLVIAPNSTLWGQVLVNHSYYPVRGVDMRFKVAIGSDVRRVKEAILSALRGTPHVLSEPSPFVAVDVVTEAWIEFLVRPFCRNADVGEVRFTAPERIKEALDAAGVAPPRPLVVAPATPASA